MTDVILARKFTITGVVQGVGFRPYIYRLAKSCEVNGWVRNDAAGVEILIEGTGHVLNQFTQLLPSQAPPSARIDSILSSSESPEGLSSFEIDTSSTSIRRSALIAPDSSICDECLEEVLDPSDRRYRYPYITCTNCGPRYSILISLPYDRANTTLRSWEMCATCARQYADPADRRFHAQPLACPVCGPHLELHIDGKIEKGDSNVIAATAKLLQQGSTVAIKGIGGYHLACDAFNPDAVEKLRHRKYRKEKPFALLVRDLDTASKLVDLTGASKRALESRERPIVLCDAKQELGGVAPENADLGIMLPYAPLHTLLFQGGAPAVLVFTSGNRSNEPIAFEDQDALDRLSDLCDAILLGERPIARRLDDSIVRCGPQGPQILRRSRGFAPSVVASLQSGLAANHQPVLAVGADLKNSITLLVDGQAVSSQHHGDLEQYSVLESFQQSIRDTLTMSGLDEGEVLVAHDSHPQYHSTRAALRLASPRHIAVQHHRAHVASVLAEHGLLSQRVLGLALDGTGYGDDGTIWGGEIFCGALDSGLSRVAWLKPFALPGGDAATRWPVQTAAGLLQPLLDKGLLPFDLRQEPFSFPHKFNQALELIDANVRCPMTSSCGRLFDAVAAVLGFARPVAFEGQAAIWLEQLARNGRPIPLPPLEHSGNALNANALLFALLERRRSGKNRPADLAFAFHQQLARGLSSKLVEIASNEGIDTVAASGGVLQNQLFLSILAKELDAARLTLLLNRSVPPNDGGISLGQAALAAISS